jgi:sodium/potassium/calcium exchanger 6
LIITAIAGSLTGVLVALFADEGNDPAARVARSAMGFLVGIVWIMAIADEVVQVLQVIVSHYFSLHSKAPL